MQGRSLPERRPAETATGLAAAVAAIVVATTGLSAEMATALVVVVGAVPAVVTAFVSLRRSTAAGRLLVGLTPEMISLAGSTIAAAKGQQVPLGDKVTALKTVAEAMSAWGQVLAAEPGAVKAASRDGDTS